MKYAALLLLLSLSCFAQSPAKKLAALQAERDYLLDQNSQLLQELKDVRDELAETRRALIKSSMAEFRPIEIGARTFHTEQSFVDYFNEVAGRLNTALDVNASLATRPVIVQSEPVIIPQPAPVIPFKPQWPVSCNSWTTSWDGGSTTSLNCN